MIRFENSDWPSYRAGLSAKWRQEVGRQGRVLERDYGVSIERHRPQGSTRGDNEPRWDMYDDCLRVSEQSWQGDFTTGNTLCHDKVRQFLRDCHGVAAHLGMLDMALLKLDGEPVAFQYNYHHDGRLYGLRMGFDPQFARQGVGRVLMSHLIEDSFARGDTELDLGIGDFDFKRRFRTEIKTSYRHSCYRWSAWRSQGVRLTRWIKGRFFPAGSPSPSKIA